MPAACLRVVRTASLLTIPRGDTTLSNNEALLGHVAAVDTTDPFFYVSHRHYLAQGLSRRQRVELAQTHYEHETNAFDEEYRHQVYKTPGLTLWKERAARTDFEIRLTPGADVLYEGGLSVVLYVDGGRVAVMSYSHVDSDTIFERDTAQAEASTPTMFVTRVQRASNHDYQRAFHTAFNRCTVAHFCMAALMGIAKAQRLLTIAAIRPEVHPGYNLERDTRFQVSYREFWESLDGRAESRFAYELPVPMKLTPFDALSSKARRRATLRRRHLDEIGHRTFETIFGHLRQPPIAAASV